jgi:7-keto-8-aminopelargonate synthetase-like enzyme
MTTNNIIDTINEEINDSLQEKVIHHFTEDGEIRGAQITVNSQKMINFASCSYLGLEQHPDLISGTVNAVQHYGTQFSSSRTFISIGLYQQLESILSEMYQKPVLVSASTTLGHMSAIPVLIKDNDAVIIDLQVGSPEI